MRADLLVELRQTLGLRGPRWTIEHDLISLALDGNEGARRILRRSREIAAARAPRTIAPTTSELRAALGGTPSQRIDVLVRMVIASLEGDTIGGTGPSTEGGGSHGPPPEVRGDDT